MTTRIIRWQGRDYEWDSSADIDVDDAMKFYEAHQITVTEWLAGMPKGDPRAWQCTYWLLMKRNGEKPRGIRDGKFGVVEFMKAYYENAGTGEEEEDKPDEPDPTMPSPSSPPGAPSSPAPPSPPMPVPPNGHAPQYQVPTAYSPSPYPSSAATTSFPSPGSAG